MPGPADQSTIIVVRAALADVDAALSKLHTIELPDHLDLQARTYLGSARVQLELALYRLRIPAHRQQNWSANA